MQRQEPHPQPPPPPRPRSQYYDQLIQDRGQQCFQIRSNHPCHTPHQYQKHLLHQKQQHHAFHQYHSPYRPPEQPQKQDEHRTASLSRTPNSSKSPMPPPWNPSNRSYSSLMKDRPVCDPEPGMENIRIDEEWIARNGAFACIWALTYKLPTKESGQMSMTPPSAYAKRP